jgi:hypothetical protein
MLFLPNDDAVEAQCKTILEATLAQEGLKLLGYRQVPVKHEVVGRFAKATQPRIMQVGGQDRAEGGQEGVIGRSGREQDAFETGKWRGSLAAACYAAPVLISSCRSLSTGCGPAAKPPRQ